MVSKIVYQAACRSWENGGKNQNPVLLSSQNQGENKKSKSNLPLTCFSQLLPFSAVKSPYCLKLHASSGICSVAL